VYRVQPFLERTQSKERLPIGGGTFVPGISAEQLPEVLELFAKQVEEGLYDDAIGVVMKRNIADRNKVTH